MSLASRLPVVRDVFAAVLKASLFATGRAGVILMVTVAALTDVPPRLSLTV